MNTSRLIHYLEKLEKQQLISSTTNRKILHFLDYNYGQFGKLFLVLCGIMGALFASAGIFALISHNWHDFPKHLRGFMSLIPLLAGLYFYYRALFQKKTTVWIESASIFLFLMIGASIALISSTYQLDGDFDKFVIVWLCSAVPLFYIGKASAITILYFGLMIYLSFPIISYGFFGIPDGYNYNEKIYWFWIFFAAFVPHLYTRLNLTEKRQDLRGIYLGWMVALLFYISLPFAFTGGWIFWAVSLVLGYFLIDRIYYNENVSILAKPFKFVAYFALFTTLVNLTNRFALRQLFRIEDFRDMAYFEWLQILFNISGVAAFVVISTLAFKKLRGKGFHLTIILGLPFILLFMMSIYYLNEAADFDLNWLGRLVFNLYVLLFGLSALFKGVNDRNILSLFYGLFVLCWLLWFRYFDTDLSFWTKGIIFIIIGGGFFLINYIYSEELDYEKRALEEREQND